MTESLPVLTQVADGRDYEVKSRYGTKRIVKIDRKWEVTLDGEVIGYVIYCLITRERRVKGRMYVEARWQTPGWKRSTTRGGRSFESYSKKEAVDSLIRDWKYTADDD